MATQRYISTSIWDDNWFIDELNASERLFYFYLLTNEHTNIAGIYKVSIRKMAAESCFSTNQVKTMLATFERTRKVYYRNEHIIMVNWPKHQKWHKLEKIHKGIRAILINQIPTTLLDTIKNESIPYQYPINSLSDGINSLPIAYPYDTNYLDSNLDSDFNSDSDSDSILQEDNIAQRDESPCAVLTLPRLNSDDFPITQSHIDTFIEAYPAVDVMAELKKMKAWLLANKKNQKKDVLRFANNWLNKAHDQAGKYVPKSLSSHHSNDRFDSDNSSPF